MIKKGMIVTINNGEEFVIVDSVSYSNMRYFAAVLNNQEIDDIYYFRLEKDLDNNNELVLIDQIADKHIVNALNNHMLQTF